MAPPVEMFVNPLFVFAPITANTQRKEANAEERK
jgi:hypothetical protein